MQHVVPLVSAPHSAHTLLQQARLSRACHLWPFFSHPSLIPSMAPSVSSPACSPNPLNQFSESSILFLTCHANLDSGPIFQLPHYLLLAAYSVGSEGPDPCVHLHTMKTSLAGELAMCIMTLPLQAYSCRKFASMNSCWCSHPTGKETLIRGGIPLS